MSFISELQKISYHQRQSATYPAARKFGMMTYISRSQKIRHHQVQLHIQCQYIRQPENQTSSGKATYPVPKKQTSSTHPAPRKWDILSFISRCQKIRHQQQHIQQSKNWTSWRTYRAARKSDINSNTSSSQKKTGHHDVHSKQPENQTSSGTATYPVPENQTSSATYLDARKSDIIRYSYISRRQKIRHHQLHM